MISKQDFEEKFIRKINKFGLIKKRTIPNLFIKIVYFLNNYNRQSAVKAAENKKVY